MRTLVAVAAFTAVLFVLALGGSALGATRHGITPLAPKAGTTVPAGRSLTFRMRVSGRGKVFVRVCRTKRRNRDGVICRGAALLEAKQRGGVREAEQADFDFAGFWLDDKGRYYWQAYRVACRGDDCRQEGPIVRFRVN